MNSKNVLGKEGEAIVCNYLKEQGLKIIATNYKNLIGEIDIIAKDNDVYVFIEVKTRSSLKFGSPREAIDYRKIQKIKKVAISYLKYKSLLDKVSVRFDCVEILGNKLDYEINHLKNIF